MEKEEFYDDEFIISLTIEGTEYEEVDAKVTDLNKTIRDQINDIIKAFELPRLDNGGQPIEYRLGNSDMIFDFVDEDGCEKCMADYNIQPGDHLVMIRKVIAG